MIPSVNNKSYYGDETRWFTGTVININDPLELGRVKVRIFGIHTSDTSLIEDGDLPWAQVITPSTEGGESGIGTNIGVKEQSQVFGIFLDGKNSQLPLVIGSIPKYERPISTAQYTSDPAVPDELQHATESSKSVIENKSADDKFLSGETNIEKAYNFFLTKEGGGFSPEQAAGIVGNFYIESYAAANKGDLNPSAQSAPPEKSFGIAQWNSSKDAKNRYQALVDFCASLNLPWQSLYGQLLFTIKELNDHKRYYKYNEIKRARTIRDACFLFEERFENPQVKKQEERVEAAEEIFRRMND